MGAGFHSFTNTVSVPLALVVLTALCCCRCLVAQDSHLFPYLCPYLCLCLFNGPFTKVFFVLFWTICGELGFPDGYSSLSTAVVRGC